MPSIPGSIGAVGNIGKALIDRPSFTERDEIRMAQETARKFEAQNKMWRQPLLEDYLTELSQRIVAVAKPRPFPYRIRIVADPNVNAFTFGGGLVYFHAGLLARMALPPGCGIKHRLASSDPGMAEVSADIVFPGGASEVAFEMKTTKVPSPYGVTLTVTTFYFLTADAYAESKEIRIAVTPW